MAHRDREALDRRIGCLPVADAVGDLDTDSRADADAGSVGATT
jgi:hypothetical protein